MAFVHYIYRSHKQLTLLIKWV